MAMTYKAPLRDPQYIPHVRDEYAFQNMCLHIYEEKYRSPGASHYGRRGQRQGGVDIFLADWATGSDKFPGTVWIQCKYTSKEELVWTKVKADIWKAAEAARSRAPADQVYLFVVATNAIDDQKLLDGYEKMKVEVDLPFVVEFHTWGTLCSSISASDRLWSLYGAEPGGIQEDFSARVIQARHQIDHFIGIRDLAQARRTAGQLEHAYSSPYGKPGASLPPDVWKNAPLLRERLLDLYERAHDAHAAYDLLQYEIGLTQSADALSCLAYPRAERIVGHLRSSDVMLRVGHYEPDVAIRIASYGEQLARFDASPDVLASLTLLVVMETDDLVLHDKMLARLDQMLARTANSPEEFNARVAHAVVRFYYVMRHGWREPACRYALGDEFHGMAHAVCSGDARLGQPFDIASHQDMHINGLDPLAAPTLRSFPRYHTLERFCRYARAGDRLSLPLLALYLPVYAIGKEKSVHVDWPAPGNVLSERRVLDMQTLAVMAAGSTSREICDRFTLFVSELTFSKLLGYRSVLRAYVKRTDSPGAAAEVLERVDALVGRCVSAVRPNQHYRGHIHVTPLYDEAPPRLQAPSDVYAFQALPFTGDLSGSAGSCSANGADEP